MADFRRRAPQIPVVLASLLLWSSLAWGLPAEAPAAEGEADVAAKDPWAGVRVSDAYDYAKCLNCGKKNEVRAESCSRCGYELPQPSAEVTDTAWVFVAGKGYYREGTLVEPVRSMERLRDTGLVLSGLGITTAIVAGLIRASETGSVGPAFYAGLGATAVGGVLLVIGLGSQKEPVYAFASGEPYELYERPGFALRSPDTEGVALKVEVTLLGF